MFLEKNDAKGPYVRGEGGVAVYMLMRNYIEHECKRSRAFTQQRDLDREVQNRLAKIFA